MVPVQVGFFLLGIYSHDNVDMEATERNGYRILVTQGKEEKRWPAWSAWIKYVGTSGLVTVYNDDTQPSTTLLFNSKHAANVYLAQKN